MSHTGCLLLFMLAGPAGVLAGPINVPNASFELPAVTRGEKNPFGALPFLDDWDETAIGLADEMDQNTGVFLNPPFGEPGHVANADLERLAFLSSLTGNGVRQELADSFTPGQTYLLTVGVATSLQFPVGASEELEIALFYFDGGVEQVVASTRATGGSVSSSTVTDFSVVLPTVQPGDAWANQPIGILIRPAEDDPSDELDEGFWDADNVRLIEADAIPAASTWGLMGLAVLLMGAGAVMVRRRATMA